MSRHGPYVGELVCDCQYIHQRIVEVLDGDDVTLEDGSHCSYRHCCDPVPHTWLHPEGEPETEWYVEPRPRRPIEDVELP